MSGTASKNQPNNRINLADLINVLMSYICDCADLKYRDHEFILFYHIDTDMGKRMKIMPGKMELDEDLITSIEDFCIDRQISRDRLK